MKDFNLWKENNWDEEKKENMMQSVYIFYCNVPHAIL